MRNRVMGVVCRVWGIGFVGVRCCYWNKDHLLEMAIQINGNVAT